MAPRRPGAQMDCITVSAFTQLRASLYAAESETGATSLTKFHGIMMLNMCTRQITEKHSEGNYNSREEKSHPRVLQEVLKGDRPCQWLSS